MLKVARRFAVLVVFVCLAAPADAAITGVVLDQTTADPVEGARVRVQGSADEPVITDELGQFTLELEDADPFEPVDVTAALPYDPARGVNFIVSGVSATDGDENVTIQLPRLADNAPETFNPVQPSSCGGCHIDQHQEWSNSHHSIAAQNEWVLDVLEEFRETHDEQESGFCATCHAPLEDVLGGGVFLDDPDVQNDSYGVDCQACHLMSHVNENFEALHHLGNADYYFPEGSNLGVWGPLDDVTQTMEASFQPQFSQAEFCASCHEYENPNNPGIPGQTTYSEWKQSPFGPDGSNEPCQSCHMPAVAGPVSYSGGPIRPFGQRRSHEIVGAAQETLEDAISLNMEVARFGEELVVATTVSNHGAGHAFPTGVSIRNAILVIEAVVDGQVLAQTAGPVVPFYGSAEGGDGPDDLAGAPGRGFARVLEGEVGGERKYPVLFIDADTVREDTRILPGTTNRSTYRFDLSAVPENATVEIEARLLYRRAWRDLAERMAWQTDATGGPIEIEIHAETESLLVQDLPVEPFFSDRFEVGSE